MSETKTRCPYCMDETVPVAVAFQDGDDSALAGRCTECGKLVVRVNGAVVYPVEGPYAEQFEALPEELRSVCVEACSLAGSSPEKACSLLMPHIEKMCDNLGAGGDTLLEKIEHLKKTGKLPADAGATLAPGDEGDDLKKAEEKAYDLLRIATYIGAGGGDYLPR